MPWIAIVFALLAGAANSFQSGANAALNKGLGRPLAAGLWVYCSGLTGVLLLLLCSRHALTGAVSRAGAVPWWAWLGGMASIGSTMAGLMLAHKLGSGLFTGLSVTAALLCSVLLDQFGWLGFRQHPASPGRLLGCGLLVAGVWLVSRF